MLYSNLVVYLFIIPQMVLSGELRCARQIVTVSNGEEKIIAYAKPMRGVYKISFVSLFCT
jgi:hypothetical protein